MTLVRLEPAAPRSQVKHSTTEPLRSLRAISVHAKTTLFDYNNFHMEDCRTLDHKVAGSILIWGPVLCP